MYSVRIAALLPQLEVGHGDAGAVYVALAAAARHAVQPAHVDAAAAPERGREHHVAVGVGHVGHVAAVIAHVEAVGVAALPHPGVGLAAVLEVGDGEGLVGVDGAAAGAHHVAVVVEGVDLDTVLLSALSQLLR